MADKKPEKLMRDIKVMSLGVLGIGFVGAGISAAYGPAAGYAATAAIWAVVAFMFWKLWKY